MEEAKEEGRRVARQGKGMAREAARREGGERERERGQESCLLAERGGERGEEV